MDAITPSRTAGPVAAQRALHQLLDAPQVFEDPLALAVLAQSPYAEASTTSLPLLRCSKH